jgi:hypothetical protein
VFPSRRMTTPPARWKVKEKTTHEAWLIGYSINKGLVTVAWWVRNFLYSIIYTTTTTTMRTFSDLLVAFGIYFLLLLLYFTIVGRQSTTITLAHIDTPHLRPHSIMRCFTLLHACAYIFILYFFLTTRQQPLGLTTCILVWAHSEFIYFVRSLY